MTAPRATIRIGRRFCGPRDSANGGYICGLLAGHASESVTVRLLKPPPLEAELELRPRDGVLELLSGEDAVAQARPGSVGELAPPPAPTYEEAVAAARRFEGFRTHPAAACFVCGPERSEGDGLRIFPGSLPAIAGVPHRVAAPWTPDATLGAGDGLVRAEFVWAALDCPGYAAAAPDMRSMLLGELTARIDRRVAVGERCLVMGWSIGGEGRKHLAGTALYGVDGALCALARAIWIEPRAPKSAG